MQSLQTWRLGGDELSECKHHRGTVEHKTQVYSKLTITLSVECVIRLRTVSEKIPDTHNHCH